MRRIVVLLLLVGIGLWTGWILCERSHATYSCNPKEVNVMRDSTYAYHLEAFQKTVHLSLSNHEVVAWTFDKDTTVDSVSAVFGLSTPFSSHHFEFSDSAAFSGAPVVPAGPTIYDYIITIYPHGHAPVTADPGIIIET